MLTLRQASPPGDAGPHAATAARLYPAAPQSVPRARRFVTAQLTGWGLPAAADDAALVTSELAGNAARQGAATSPAEVLVRVTRHGHLVIIEAGDHDPAAPACPSAMASEDAEHGRGLILVAALADDWGWYPDGNWKMVWAALRVRRRCTASRRPRAGLERAA